MATTKVAFLALLVILSGSGSFVEARCPYAGRTSAGAPPKGHPAMPSASSGAAARKLFAKPASPALAVDAFYLAAMRALIDDLSSVIGACQFSQEGMKYDNNTNIPVASSSIFFPAGSWLRAFFHDAGTYLKKAGTGGPNGSLGVGCPSNTCGSIGTAVAVAANATCANNDTAAGGFSDGLSYCCPAADECIAHGQSNNTGTTPGLTVPVCLKGSPASVELCRRENDNLLPTIQFFRKRQADPLFKWGSPPQPLSLADIIVAAAAVAVKQCSGQAVNITHTFGRPEAAVADTTMLPSPASVIEEKHFSVFKNMGLNKIDMVTLVTGSHAIGGFRHLASGLTDAPFVPFDCTPAGQISRPAGPPFDNNVFRVACDGVQGVTTGYCAWSAKCTNPSLDETAKGCPFTGPARDAFAAANATNYPAPGLNSDIFLCNDPPTQGRMLSYANDQAFFFSSYVASFTDLASLGFKNKDLVPQNW